MNTNERATDELRLVRILPDYTEMAAGSVLICCGRTKVICTASVQEDIGYYTIAYMEDRPVNEGDAVMEYLS